MIDVPFCQAQHQSRSIPVAQVVGCTARLDPFLLATTPLTRMSPILRMFPDPRQPVDTGSSKAGKIHAAENGSLTSPISRIRRRARPVRVLSGDPRIPQFEASRRRLLIFDMQRRRRPLVAFATAIDDGVSRAWSTLLRWETQQYAIWSLFDCRHRGCVNLTSKDIKSFP
jgi:hypothetical protein